MTRINPRPIPEPQGNNSPPPLQQLISIKKTILTLLVTCLEKNEKSVTIDPKTYQIIQTDLKTLSDSCGFPFSISQSPSPHEMLTLLSNVETDTSREHFPRSSQLRLLNDLIEPLATPGLSFDFTYYTDSGDTLPKSLQWIQNKRPSDQGVYQHILDYLNSTDAT